MANKRKGKASSTADKPKGLVAVVRPGETPDRAVARKLMSPNIQAGLTIRTLEGSDRDLRGFVDELSAQVTAVHSGDMRRAEAMLITQAHTLNELFNNLTRRAASNMGEYTNAAETYFRLALKAQSQCRATLETLSTVKNPPVIYARQANVTTGPQQINNAVSSPCARETEIEQNKLLEVKDGERLDTRATGTAGGLDPDMATVGQVNRAKDGGG